jgi:lipopolysaccharide/colanic/teichoic acid biosynthesis glycosyltransferase
MADPLPSVPSVEPSVVGVPDQAESNTHVVLDLTRERPPLDLTTESAHPRPGLLHASNWQLAIKRSMDVALSALLLLLLFPLMVMVMLAIRLSSRGPTLLSQERIGQNGVPFEMLKFRSMRVGAHEELEDLAQHNEVSGPAFKIRKDPRITPVGRVIRKLSLDELPQLFNVLLGDMSLVGPRPPLRNEVAEYTAYQRQRLLVRPGITCIWQVSGRCELDFDTWVEMDLRYIDGWTLRTDLVLLLRTIPAVISGRGAF